MLLEPITALTLLLAQTGQGELLASRGASNAQVRVQTTERGLELQVSNLTPGSYRVLLASSCPLERRPTDIGTGKVDSRRRSGTETRPLPDPKLRLGTLLISDRTPSEHSVSMPASAEGSSWTHVLIQEGEVSPSLSDRFGLVACGPRPS